MTDMTRYSQPKCESMLLIRIGLLAQTETPQPPSPSPLLVQALLLLLPDCLRLMV